MTSAPARYTYKLLQYNGISKPILIRREKVTVISVETVRKYSAGDVLHPALCLWKTLILVQQVPQCLCENFQEIKKKRNHLSWWKLPVPLAGESTIKTLTVCAKHPPRANLCNTETIKYNSRNPSVDTLS